MGVKWGKVDGDHKRDKWNKSFLKSSKKNYQGEILETLQKKKKPKWKAEFVGTSHHQPRTVREVAIRLSRQVEGTGLRTVDLGERWHGHCLLRGCHHQVLAAQVNRKEPVLKWNMQNGGGQNCNVFFLKVATTLQLQLFSCKSDRG